MSWLALDIGGANLKMADGRGFAISYPFALWRDSDQLARELRTLLTEGPAADHLAVTMTGELADCFDSKEIGVQFIVESLEQAADGRHTRIYLSDGKLVSPQVAVQRPQLAAASNWHALGRYAARFIPEGSGLVLDIGSTTVDVLPICDGELRNTSTDDTSRLISGELIYTGVERTPICALIQSAPYRGSRCMVAAEHFATTLDAYVLCNDIPESTLNKQTADCRSATKANARLRVSRLVGAPEDFNHRDAVGVALEVIDKQVETIVNAAERVVSRLPTPLTKIVVSGHGDYLAERVLKKMEISCEAVSMSAMIGRLPARCGPAHALAVLASEALQL